MSETADFGFQQVPPEEKTRRVRAVFESVAGRYDLMNDLMSAGVHRLWKRYALLLAAVRPGQQVLDLAGGTGDLAARLARRVGPRGRVVLSDINAAMLGMGRRRLTDRGLVGNLDYVQADAEALPFTDASFDRLTIAFGLRNVTRKQAALASMLRVLKPGGAVMILEFSRVVVPLLERIYDAYSFRLLPLLGQWVAGDREAYQYLVESIRRHPDQETLAGMMREAGFEAVRYHNLSGGIVAAHLGYKV